MRKSQRPQRLLKRGLVSTGALPSPSSATQHIQDDRVFTACPECGAELQAALKIYLYGVEVNSAGLLIKYDGGPQPENEDDILELCDLQNTTVYCANDRVFKSDTTVRTKGAQPPAVSSQRIQKDQAVITRRTNRQSRRPLDRESNITDHASRIQ